MIRELLKMSPLFDFSDPLNSEETLGGSDCEYSALISLIMLSRSEIACKVPSAVSLTTKEIT